MQISPQDMVRCQVFSNYFVERKKMTKINQASSSWDKILFGISQGSIVGTILFNIVLINLFLVVQDIDFTSYADNNSINTPGKSIYYLIYPESFQSGLQITKRRTIVTSVT